MIKTLKNDYKYTTNKLEKFIGREIPIGISKTIYALRWSGVALSIVTVLLWNKL